MELFLKKIIFRIDFSHHFFKLLDKSSEIMDRALNNLGFDEVQYSNILSLVRKNPFINMNFQPQSIDLTFEAAHIDFDEYAEVVQYMDETIMACEYKTESIRRIGTRYYIAVEGFLPKNQIIDRLSNSVPLPKAITRGENSSFGIFSRAGKFVSNGEEWDVNLLYSAVDEKDFPNIYRGVKLEAKEGLYTDIDLFKIYTPENRYSFKSVKLNAILNKGYTNATKIVSGLVEAFDEIKQE